MTRSATRIAIRNFLAVTLVTATAFTLAGCGDTWRDDASVVGVLQEAAAPVTAAAGDKEQPKGLQFRVRDAKGGEEGGPVKGARTVEGQALPEARTGEILQRMQPLASAKDDEKAFALREGSPPPPRPGTEEQGQFPPKGSGDAEGQTPIPAKLEVVRFSPEGEVPIAPQISVTFSQPMVPLTSHEALSKLPVPVTVSPAVEGEWQWVGTKTLLFKSTGARMPMATRYTVTVPKGTRSDVGSTLEAQHSFTFQTPAVKVVDSYPRGNGQSTDPILFFSFDQRVDPDAAMKHIRVHTIDKPGNIPVEVRRATDAEIAADASVRRRAENTEPGRFVAFKPTEPLPNDQQVKVEFAAGATSAEGPRLTEKAQGFAFRTYGPMVVKRHGGAWGKKIQPMQPWFIEFSNPLDQESFEIGHLSVTPEIPGFDVQSMWGSRVNVRGLTKGNTTYKLTVGTKVKDIYGQTLEAPKTLTFRVGPADPAMSVPASPFVVLDPHGKPRLDVFTVNQTQLEVKVYNVAPLDWGAYTRHIQDERRVAMPGDLVMEYDVTIKGEADELTATSLDLAGAFEKCGGNAVVWIRGNKARLRATRPHARVWVQRAQLAVSAYADQEEALVWVTNLADGTPIENAEVTLLPERITARTRADGTAMIKLPPAGTGRAAGRVRRVITAKAGEQAGFVPDSGSYWGGGYWARRTDKDTLAWYVVNDRGMYKPGESVSIKGWVRKLTAGKGSDVTAAAVQKVTYRVVGARGNEIVKGEVEVGPLMGFDFEAALPKNANLGWARVELSAIGADDANGIRTNHNFQIQEFRRPKFEVTAKGSQGPHLVGASAEVTVSAKYFAGGALPGAPVNWSVNASPASFTPPNRSDYTFGTWVPWWRSHYEGGGSHQRFEGTTDGKGDHRIRLDFTKVDPPRPTTVTATANVEDVDRQSWSAAATLLVHPSLRYVGVRTESTFVDPGDEVKIETIVTDLDGALLAGETVKFTADRLAWTFTKGEWSEEVKETIEGEASSLADGPATFAFTPKAGGRFRVRAQVADDQDRPNQSELTIWVSGGDQPSLDRVELEEATLIPSGETFQPGDTARILVQSPFTPAEGLLTLRRNGIVRAERFQMDAPTKVLEVKIDESHLPGVTVQVELVGQAERAVAAQTTKEIPARPAFARGSLRLKVPPTSRTLTVEAKPRETELEPGGETTIDLTVRDAQGRPVKDAEALVVVVDEAILSLTGYRLPDPMNTFYPARGAGTRDQDVRGFVKLASLAELEEVGSADDNDATAVFDAEAMSDGASGGEMAGAAPPGAPMASARAMRKNGKGRGAAQPAIRVRKDLRALALFAPAVRTDADGAASVAVKLPDSLTRYRVMVIAASGDKQFGKSEATITARMPLMVRPSPPRFLSYGDRAELPIVVHNQTKDPITVEVSLRVTNLGVELPGGGTADQAGRRIEVPAKDRVEVRFPIVARKPGTARFQVAAVAGGYADAAERDFPVWTPATTEGFATYGVLDEEWATYNIQAPADAVTEFGGLTIETSSTQLQALTDAVVYLVDYPYSCTEQISSRVLAIAALRDVLAAFQAEGLPGADDLALAMEEDLSELSRRQNGDGSFGFWRRGGRDWPYLTIHAAHAATRAGDKGFNVPKRLLDRSKKYLREIRSHLDPKWSLAVRQSMEAYALYVRHRMGDSDADAIYRLIKEAGGIKKLPIEALGFCVTALADAGETGDVIEEALRYFQNQVTETAGAAQFTASYSDGAHLILHTARRTDAILLESVMAADPKSDLIPKLVRGLLAHKKKGRWGNTQENCFILLSLDRYFRAYEKATPDFVAQAWLGDGYAGERTYQGRETVNHTVNVPMAALVDPEGQSQALVLRKKGEGRLYYRLGLRYAPRSLDLEPMERGFVVQRRYEALDDPADVSRDEDGTWRIRAGARVRVRLGMVAQARRYHVALVDPLPAGLEPVNPALAVSRADGADPGSQARVGRHWWWGPWYEHQNLRDERAEAFASIVYGGVYEYSYVARATTPGHFVAAPAKAEEMYSPDVFGRSGTDKVIVE